MKDLATWSIKLNDSAPEGEDVIAFYSNDPKEKRKYLSKLLHSLIVDKKLEEEQIVMIIGHKLNKTFLAENNPVGRFNIVENGPAGKYSIPYYTHIKFKGLDSDVVILVDVDPEDSRWNKSGLYTAVSRASHLLYMIYK